MIRDRQSPRFARAQTWLQPFTWALVGVWPGLAWAAISWPEKSGPTHDGQVAAADARNLPVEWSEADGRGIAWKVRLEGEGLSTPAIGHGRLWFTSATPDGHRQFVDCVQASDGQVLHHQLLFENPDPEPLGNATNTYASPSCVLEDDAVYAHFGTYGTARLDPATCAVVWQRRDINCRHFRGPGSSPIVFEDLLILSFDGIDQQFVIALDKRTGETVWRTKRSTDFKDQGPDGRPIGDGDFRKAYQTPAVTLVVGRPQLVSVGSRAAFGYDARTGEELWTVEHEDYNAAARPIFFRGLAILTTGAGGMQAVRLDATTRGPASGSHVVWRRPRGAPKLPTPVVVGERLYCVTDNGVLSCLDPLKGQEVWSKRLGGDFVASPLVAGDLIYLCDRQGRTTVVRAGDTFEQVAQNELVEGLRASPAAAEGALYLRTDGHLYRLVRE
jgi:outer membrane protein assembly factor BamB